MTRQINHRLRKLEARGNGEVVFVLGKNHEDCQRRLAEMKEVGGLKGREPLLVINPLPARRNGSA
jgi:hypothetical protein